MTDLLRDPRSVWAIVLVVIVPVLIIAVGELEERLRQRDSRLTGVVSIVRRWTIPLFTVWAVLIGLVGLTTNRPEVRLVGTALLLSLASVALQIVRILVGAIRRGSKDDARRLPALLLALPRIVVIAVAFWVLLDGVWGVDLTGALTALGLTSLVVSFAFQDTLSGLASGFLLLGDAPFQPGDWIQFGDLEGEVIDINWRSSRIKNRNGDLVIVPNSQLAGAVLVNYDQPTRTHRVVVPVQVAFANPPTVAKDMLLDAARSTPGVLEDPPPIARVVQVDDPLMGYEVDLWIDDFSIAPKVRSDFGSLVWYSSQRHGVPLPSPAYDLFVFNGPEAAAAGAPDEAEVRGRLATSVLLDQLDEEEISRLASGARALRFAAGETIVSGAASSRDLYVIWSGRARVAVDLPGDGATEIAELGTGDLFRQIGPVEGLNQLPRVTAVTDCEVVMVAEAAAGYVASQNAALSRALNQMTATRQRRIQRLLDTALPREEGSPAGDPPAQEAGGR